MQSRSGCACAGPYGTTLIAPLLQRIIKTSPEAIARTLEIGAPNSPFEWLKPGWTRVYFSHMMTPAEVDYVIRSVLEVARHGWKLLPQYDFERLTGAHLRACMCSLTNMSTPWRQMTSRCLGFQRSLIRPGVLRLACDHM